VPVGVRGAGGLATGGGSADWRATRARGSAFAPAPGWGVRGGCPCNVAVGPPSRGVWGAPRSRYRMLAPPGRGGVRAEPDGAVAVDVVAGESQGRAGGERGAAEGGGEAGWAERTAPPSHRHWASGAFWTQLGLKSDGGGGDGCEGAVEWDGQGHGLARQEE
jgi:hypothetical protein